MPEKLNTNLNKQTNQQASNINKEASFARKRQEYNNRYQALQNPSQLKTEAKKTAIKQGIKGAASLAGVPPGVAEAVMQSSKADTLLTKAAEAESVEAGVAVIIQHLIAEQRKKVMIGIASIALVPLFLIVLIFGKYSDSISYVQGETFEGYEQLYTAVDNVSNQVRRDYGVNVDKNLIVSALTALTYNDDYSNENAEMITITEEDQEGRTNTLSVSQYENKAKLLALYQIEQGNPSCTAASNTVREIASNDREGVSVFANPASFEKNYNCNATDTYYRLSNTQGTIDNNNSGGVFFWNLIDESFLEDHHKDEFDGLNGEEILAKKLEMTDYIYMYAEMLDEYSPNSAYVSSGTCEFDDLIVKTYECRDEVSMNNVTNQNIDERYFIEAYSFEDYIKSVTYQEAGYYSNLNFIEYVKAQSIAARSYALTRSGYTDGKTFIQLRACTEDQVPCNYRTGCSSRRADGSTSVYPNLTSGHVLKSPLADNVYLAELDKVRGVVLRSNTGSILNTPYLAENYGQFCRHGWCLLAVPARDQLAASGRSYEEILRHYYTNNEYSLVANCQSSSEALSFGEKGQVVSGNSHYIKTEFFSNYNINNTDIEFDGALLNTNNNSSGPASLAMIVNALSDGFEPLKTYFATAAEPSSGTNKLQVVTKMHRYLYKNSAQEELGGSKSSTYGNSVVSLFDIKSLGEFNNGDFTARFMKDHLRDGKLILAYITNDKCPAGTNICEGLGSTSGNHFVVIYGYNSGNNSFNVHNPSLASGNAKSVKETIAADRITSITVYGGN